MTLAHQPNSKPHPLPPDDLTRNLAISQPETDQSLTHLAVVGDTYTILLSGAQTAGRLALIDMLIPPVGGPPPHRHDFEETFHVLEGEIELIFRGQAAIAKVGETVHIPALAPHGFQNKGNCTARLLCIVSPAGQEEFFQQIGDPVASRTSPAPELSAAEREDKMKRAAELMRQYGNEPVKA